jgi:hypothetical protein
MWLRHLDMWLRHLDMRLGYLDIKLRYLDMWLSYLVKKQQERKKISKNKVTWEKPINITWVVQKKIHVTDEKKKKITNITSESDI